jgi:S-disulfanyl-L-cysteine oxidoreductase SoxD
MSMLKPSILKLLAAGLVVVLAAEQAAAESPSLGRPIAEADIKAWDITILPDGTGLPPGSGTPAQGARVYAEKGCAACHGENASGGSNVALVGKPPLDRIEARKTIANFWANATTLFDSMRRSMPWPQPQTLSNDEVYALTAYILALNNIIGETEVMNAQTLPKVKMPNRDNFIIRFPDRL